VADDSTPRGGSAITPYLIVRNAAEAILFYNRAFDAIETARFDAADGRIAHAELGIGDGRIYIADEFPEQSIFAPQAGFDPPVILDLDVNDVEAWVTRALALGATLVRPLDLPPDGLQTGKIRDPFGHVWLLTRFITSAVDDAIE
jgi:PhnB protein